MFRKNQKSIIVRNRIILAFVIVVNSLFPVQALAGASALVNSAGTVDTTFDTDGKVTTFLNTGMGFAVATQPDGKILVAGKAYQDFALARYNGNGSLDTTFDSDGNVTTDFPTELFGSGDDVAWDVAIQPDGKIVLVGETSGGFGYYQSFAVARYNSNGSLDTSFGGDGRVTTDFGNENSGRSVAIQTDGKIIVAGLTSSGSTSYFALARYNTNGSLDETFGEGGKLIVDFNGWRVDGGQIALQPDGKILLAGTRRDPFNEHDFGVARFYPDGTLDTSFHGGKAITNIASEDDFGNAIALQPDGKIILAGSSYKNGVSYPVMARYQTDGELDSTFGTDGKVISSLGGMEAKSVILQSNGRIILGGYAWGQDGPGGNFALERYNRDGSLDMTFGTGGRAIVDFGANDQALSAAIQRDGKILLAGYTNGYTEERGNFIDLALARFAGDETLTVTKSADTNDGTCNGDCSLREAIQTVSSGGTINFLPSLSGKTITLGSPLLLTKDLTIDAGELAAKIIISGNNNVRAMDITLGATVILNHLIVKNGNADMAGGIFNEATLYITNSTITNNSAGQGGGIYNDHVLDVTNSTIAGNEATYDGGGIHSNSGTLTITNSVVSNNSSGGSGAGVYSNPDGMLDIVDSSISSNSALQAGGGINSQGTLKLTNSEVLDNSAILNGGGVFSFGPMEISNSVISGNQGESGGGIISYDNSTIVESRIANNSATEGGGIINVGTLSITGSVVTGNAATYGAGIASSFNTLNLNASTLSGNAAVEAGGGIMTQGAVINVTNSTFDGNSAAGGGAVFANYDPNTAAELEFVNSTFYDNVAEVGGGIFNNGATLNLTNSTFSHNAADTGGGIYNVGTLNYRNTILANSISGADCYNVSTHGTLGANVSNLVETNAAAPDDCGAPAITADPRLGPLAGNNGFTQTLALLSGSPAINAGNDASCPEFDQRWITRPQGSHCDIGAYETEGSIEVSIGAYGAYPYPVGPGASERVSYQGINSGPVKVVDVEHSHLMAAERVIYKVGGANTSFSEMMALPAGQVDRIYWLPWYNNGKELDTQLRIANVSAEDAHVQVFIGDLEVARGTYTLQPGEGMRENFPGVNAGPVKIVSDQDIVAAERLIYKTAGGINTSFSEMMALPDNQLDTMYWLPWYNNVGLDTQLRIANVGQISTMVHVYVGDDEVKGSPFELDAGQSTRQSFDGINDGPVRIKSDVPIVVAERVIYKVHGNPVSFSEVMALPNKQLDKTYWLPWYNNNGKDLDTQLRFANVGDAPAMVYVYIGGVEMEGSPFEVGVGQSTRQSFAGVNDGPVRIVSNVPIVAAERLIYKINTVAVSYSEMMALPDTQLDSVYWLPWYNNNKDLDTQLRFGMP